MLLIRSHRQRLATTCDSSTVRPYPRVQVRGRSWSSVAVDVPTDVGQALLVVGLAGCMYGAEHLILGQVFLNQPLSAGITDLACWGLGSIPSAWRSPTTRCPGGNTPPHRLPSLPPGHGVVALGEVDGMPHSHSRRAEQSGERR